ncbi:MAG TPA: hypothetical protein PK992_15200, partial [Planctomycetaceae bacterium]|nr:hypothetical protein [Planctomycetaceae bacterium]
QLPGEHIPAPPPNVPDFPEDGNAGSLQSPFSSWLAGCGIPMLNGISVTHDRSRLHPAPAVQYNAGQFEMRNSCPNIVLAKHQ